MTRTRRNKRTWRNRTKEIKKKKREQVERKRKKEEIANVRFFLLPLSSLWPSLGEKKFIRTCYLIEIRIETKTFQRWVGRAKRIQLPKWKRVRGRWNVKMVRVALITCLLWPPVLEGRKSLVTQGQGKNRLQRPPSLSLSLSHARTHAHNPFFPPYTHWSRDGQV